MDTPLLDVSGLTVAYGRGLGRRADKVAVQEVSFSVTRGQTLGLIGESGSGKSTVLNAIAGLVKPVSGHIRYKGEDVTSLSKTKRRAFRREFAMLFQSAAVNPKMKVFDIIAEPLRNIEKITCNDKMEPISALLERVQLPASFAWRYPGELSGGQLQRVAIARALAVKPSLLLADEPVTALDVSVRKQILDMLRGLCSEMQIACIFVTHDLGVARNMCDSFCIMRQGTIIEQGASAQIFEKPKNLYTKWLIASILPIDLEQREQARLQRTRLWQQQKGSG